MCWPNGQRGSNQATIRDIEQGKDVKLLNLQAVAAALAPGIGIGGGGDLGNDEIRMTNDE
jgi:hypothetical protein